MNQIQMNFCVIAQTLLNQKVKVKNFCLLILMTKNERLDALNTTQKTSALWEVTFERNKEKPGKISKYKY